MKIAILGAGALGSLLGASLSTYHDVVLYGRKEHVDAVRQSGLRVSGVHGDLTYAIATTTDLTDQRFDLGIVAVKNYDTIRLFEQLQEQKVSFDVITSIQNGLKDEALIDYFGIEWVLGCVVDEAAKIVSPGHVCYTNSGFSYFGSLSYNCSNSRHLHVAESLADALCSSHFKAEVSTELEKIVWYKFMGANTICVNGALNLNAAQKYTNPFACQIFLRCIDEIVSVAAAEKIELSSHPMLNHLFLVKPTEREKLVEEKRASYQHKTAEPHVPSLVQDLRKGKTITEADWIMGALLKLAEKHKLTLPTTETCYQIIKAKEYQNNLKFL